MGLQRGRGLGGGIRRASGVKLASIFFGSVFIIFCRKPGRELNVSSKVLEELSRSWVGGVSFSKSHTQKKDKQERL